jgi:hypothetical protein
MGIIATLLSFTCHVLMFINIGSMAIKEDEMDRSCSTNGEKRYAYRILVGNPEGKRPLGRPRRRWVDNIKWILGR